MRAFEWFNIGDQFGQGMLILELVGAVTFARGGRVIVLAMLYAPFCSWHAPAESWAWWLALIVAAISILLVLSVIIQGESVSRAGFWLIAPISSSPLISWRFQGARRPRGQRK